MVKWFIAVATVIGVSAASFAVHRSIVSDAVQEGKPIAEKREADREEQLRVKARTDTLQLLLSKIEEGLAEHPFDSLMVISAGNTSYDLQQYDKAERYYRRFLENIDNSHASVKIDLGFVVFQQSRPDEAMVIVKSVIDADPSNQTAIFNMAYMLEQQEEVEEAYGWLERCRDVNPDSPLGKQATAVLAQRSTDE